VVERNLARAAFHIGAAAAVEEGFPPEAQLEAGPLAAPAAPLAAPAAPLEAGPLAPPAPLEAGVPGST
jgi:hypothetical protein